jgi:hypothetical protein
MFKWFGVWSKIKGSLGEYARGHVRKLLSKFKNLRASTTQDLADLIADSATFRAMKIPDVRTTDRIDDPRANAKLELFTVPVSFISSSQVLAQKLSERLATNVDLSAARNALGISDEEWPRILTTYAASFVHYATPIALLKLIETEAQLYSDWTILAIAEGEAYNVNGEAGYHNMVKFVSIPSYRNRRDELRTARRLWNRRRTLTYMRNV